MKPDDCSLSNAQLARVRAEAKRALQEAGALGKFPTPIADIMAVANVEEVHEDVLNEGFVAKLRAKANSAGQALKSVRMGLKLTLRAVEEASGQEVSNAYLSQLENGKVSKPSPHVLYSLAKVYAVSYENLMERAGYISATNSARSSSEKHGRAATFSIDHLSADEENELLKYLSFYRSQKRG